MVTISIWKILFCFAALSYFTGLVVWDMKALKRKDKKCSMHREK